MEALIELLIKKGIITRQEYDKSVRENSIVSPNVKQPYKQKMEAKKGRAK